MEAVPFHAVGDIRLEEVPDPKIKESADPGTMPGMKPARWPEGVDIVEKLGA